MDRDHVGDLTLGVAFAGGMSGAANRASGEQMSRQSFPQTPAGLDVQVAIDRFVRRPMRDDNLLRLRKKRRCRSDDLRHDLRIDPSLKHGFRPTSLNQLRAAAIAYIRLRAEFLDAAVALDDFSRRVVGWATGPSLESELPLAALEEARRPTSELACSDCGTQYASRQYVDKLRGNGVRISMSCKGNPYDNAFAESFTKTLKTERGLLQRARRLGGGAD